MEMNAHPKPRRRAGDALIARALKVLEDRLEYERVELSNPNTVRDFVRLRLAELKHEVFAVIWLDTQNRVLTFEEVFRGTLSQSTIYPRELVRLAIHHNAAAAILVHNHPSGAHKPSAADLAMTKGVMEALALVDVRVLDHFIVGGAKRPFSFAENGVL